MFLESLSFFLASKDTLQIGVQLKNMKTIYWTTHQAPAMLFLIILFDLSYISTHLVCTFITFLFVSHDPILFNRCFLLHNALWFLVYEAF